MKKLLFLLFLIPNLVMAEPYATCTKIAKLFNSEKGKEFFLKINKNKKIGLKQIACKKNPTKIIGEYIILDERFNNLSSDEERQLKFIADKSFAPFFCKAFLNSKLSIDSIKETLKAFFEIRAFNTNGDVIIKKTMSFGDCPF